MPLDDHHCGVGENVRECLSVFVVVVVDAALKIETCVFALIFPISKTRPGSLLSLWLSTKQQKLSPHILLHRR